MGRAGGSRRRSRSTMRGTLHTRSADAARKNEIPDAALTAKRIVLIGGHADIGVLSGGGSSQVRSVGGAPIKPLGSPPSLHPSRVTWHASSPLAAIRALAPKARVDFCRWQRLDTCCGGEERGPGDRLANAMTARRPRILRRPDLAGNQRTPRLPRRSAHRRGVAPVKFRACLWLRSSRRRLVSWLSVAASARCLASVNPRAAGSIFPAADRSGTASQCPASTRSGPRPIAGRRHDQTFRGRIISREGSDVGYRWYARQAIGRFLPLRLMASAGYRATSRQRGAQGQLRRHQQQSARG